MQVEILSTRCTGISIVAPVKAFIVRTNEKSIRVCRGESTREETFKLLKVTRDGRKVYSNGPRERIVL